MARNLSAAIALAIGAFTDPMGVAPVIHKGKHRTPADSKAGRQMTSVTRYQSASNKYAGQVEDPRFSSACERRRRQMARRGAKVAA